MSSPFQQSFNSKSPLNSSSPDRVLSDRDIQRKLNKADRKFKKLKGDGSRRDIRKLEAGMLAQEQAERKRSGGVRGEAPFHQERKSLNPGAVESVMKNQNVSEKEAIAIVNKKRSEAKSNAEKKKTGKWSAEKCKSKRETLKKELAKDPYSEFGSILKTQIANNC
jgi:hypothetical protein|tara:strand:+ start:28 stop:522 length:495 start_codon:yes stop_codon:yes gene_type:complete